MGRNPTSNPCSSTAAGGDGLLRGELHRAFVLLAVIACIAAGCSSPGDEGPGGFDGNEPVDADGDSGEPLDAADSGDTNGDSGQAVCQYVANTDAPTTYSCGNSECRRGEEYCVTRSPGIDVSGGGTSRCESFPDDCMSESCCDCVQQAADAGTGGRCIAHGSGAFKLEVAGL